MPWKVVKDTNACSVSKPWAVKNTDTGAVDGRCHESKEKAEAQKRALYASYRREGKKLEEYPQIVRAITGTPWLIVPENLKAILDIVNMRLNGDAFSDEEIEIRLKAAKEESEHENPRVQVGGGVGVVSLYGPIFPKANLMTMLSGATSLDVFTNDLRTLMEDDKVKQIVIDFNTPGGQSEMVEETGSLIKQAGETKPVYGIANTNANSAGLWLLSQCTKAYATPSGKVGSLGVYTAHEDISAQDAKFGRKITVVSAGESKTLLNPHEPLSEEGEAYLKETVEEIYDDFVGTVAEGRNVSKEYVLENFGGGKVFSARKAKSVGMIDDVISINDLLGSLVESNGTQSVNAKSDLERHVNRLQAETNSSVLSMSAAPVEVVDESKELEHSEPGTGNPPEPRKEGDGSDDPAIKSGSRRETPPIAKPAATESKAVLLLKETVAGIKKRNVLLLDDKTAQWLSDAETLLAKDTSEVAYSEIRNMLHSTPQKKANVVRTNDTVKGGTTVGELTEKDLRELLKIAEVDDEEKLVESIRIKLGELDDLQNSQNAADQEKMFAEKYPQYWDEHRKLMERDRIYAAHTFADSVFKVRKTEGYGLKETGQGLSTIARDKIEETHKKFSDSTATIEDFEETIKAIVNGGIVMFSEIGSSQNGDDPLPDIENDTPAGVAGNRKLFGEVMAKIQKDNPSMDFNEALAEAIKKHPDLAELYKVALPA